MTYASSPSPAIGLSFERFESMLLRSVADMGCHVSPSSSGALSCLNRLSVNFLVLYVHSCAPLLAWLLRLVATTFAPRIFEASGLVRRLQTSVPDAFAGGAAPPRTIAPTSMPATTNSLARRFTLPPQDRRTSRGRAGRYSRHPTMRAMSVGLREVHRNPTVVRRTTPRRKGIIDSKA